MSYIFLSNSVFTIVKVVGDVVQLTTESGSITKQYNYDAFGVEQNRTENDVNPFRYCGEYYDSESGNIYLRARYYDSNIGRFISEDPVKDGMNWYSYCGGNPVSLVDPSGLEYGKVRDFVMDYYQAFDAKVDIQCNNDDGYVEVTLGDHKRIFFYDGTIINGVYDENTGELTGFERTKVADNIDGTLYMQRSTFVTAMGLTQSGEAEVKVSDDFYVSATLSILDFASYISDAVSSGSDVKDVTQFLRAAPALGQTLKNAVIAGDIFGNIANNAILSTGNYKAESVIVSSPYHGWYSYQVSTLYRIDEGTASNQWFTKNAFAWGIFPSM